jgi:putative transposase
MPRQPRYFLPGYPQHIIIRGVNRQDTFFEPDDYDRFMTTLGHAADQYGCAIHGYVLMTNHVHMLVTPKLEDAIPKVMQAIGRSYVQWLNRKYERTGALWQGRYKSCLVQDDQYLLTCQRYIELNPVRAGLVAHPAAYLHSSYHCNALGRSNPLLTAHEVYLGLGQSALDRCTTYSRMFGPDLDAGSLARIRESANACLVLGTESFKDHIELTIKRSVRPAKMGRPRKSTTAEMCGSTLLLDMGD